MNHPSPNTRYAYHHSLIQTNEQEVSPSVEKEIRTPLTKPWFEDKVFLEFTEANGLEQSSYRLLDKLHNYKTIVVLDDSASMNELTNPETSMTLSKWHDCKHILKIILDAHHALNISCDLYTLNRGHKYNVNNWQDVKAHLSVYPSGETNMLRVLNTIYEYEMSSSITKPLLIYILTDGYPTNDAKVPDIEELQEFLLHRIWKQPVHYSLFLANESEQIEWLYAPIKYKYSHIDITQTFLGQLAVMRRAHGTEYPPFTFADYVLKILLGAIDSYYHQLDSRRVWSAFFCCCLC